LIIIDLDAEKVQCDERAGQQIQARMRQNELDADGT
jgi:hypothetical protein